MPKEKIAIVVDATLFREQPTEVQKRTCLKAFKKPALKACALLRTVDGQPDSCAAAGNADVCVPTSCPQLEANEQAA